MIARASAPPTLRTRVAARRYAAAGFVRTRELPARRWGVDVVEERHERELG